nr:chorismate mutase [Govania unica]
MIDVRREIDRIDRAMVTLIAERENYIQQAGHIKQSRDTVRDEARIQDVLDKVTVTAQATGANPDLVTTVYRTMMEWCIAYEFTVFDAKGE